MTDYEVPKWAGKPSAGIHLDVLKEGKLIQKIMVDEKKCYFFGRNPQLNDVLVDHQSCSRVHAALIYHKVLERNFLVDLGSTHGTFIGSTRIESRIPTQLPIDSSFHFGASTRIFTLRNRPVKTSGEGDDCVDILPGPLPQDEIELDNLTEYNTLSNKRITLVGITDLDESHPPLPHPLSHTGNRKESHPPLPHPLSHTGKNPPLPHPLSHTGKNPSLPPPSHTGKRKSVSVRFKEEEDLINPEDVDPSVGKFRNLVQTEIVSTKRRKSDLSVSSGLSVSSDSRETFHILRPDHDTSTSTGPTFNPLISNSLSIRLGIHLPNPAPSVDHEETEMSVRSQGSSDLYADAGMIDTAHAQSGDTVHAQSGDASHPQSGDTVHAQSGDSEESEQRKKKMYAKEAWPGRKPPGLF